MMQRLYLLIVAISCFGHALSYKNPHFVGNRTTIVHLFEWKWNDIALECENFLGPRGFGGVQVSPVNENLKITSQNRPWWERYQPVSYKMETRSGNEKEFSEMVSRCNFAGVRIYVDAILNHMSGNFTENTGTGGSKANYSGMNYPDISYSAEDFNHPICTIENYNNAVEARNCQLYGLRDLNQTSEYVRNKLVTYLNNLISMGVAGFRIDAAKHMWPKDLQVIYEKLHNLNSNHGFPQAARPYIYQEVVDLGGDDISRDLYTPLGAITEFRAGIKLGIIFRGLSPLNQLKDWATSWGLVNSTDSLVFMENQDNQRGHGVGSGIVLTYKQSKAYKAALAFELAQNYGTTRIMSSFAFTDSDAGPPMNANETIVSPIINSDGSCDENWVCEHRWGPIYQMVEFRNQVNGTILSNWWDNGNNQIAFSRGSSGFIAINMEGINLSRSFETDLPQGTYCDVMSGGRVGSRCAGKSVVLDFYGRGVITIQANDPEYAFAIHIGSASML
ncbi:alpha-amylase A-like [Arctopsyche grandis]|uniref:alpha-amylase A-like n=1 Tax=Arctopsyche grandis TaxID=121162 RepID=UPI00406D6462